MYINMYIFNVDVFIYLFIYINIYIYIYRHIHIYMYIYIDICICVYVYICIYVRVQNLRNVHASRRADCAKRDGSVEDDQEHEEQKFLDEVGVCEVPAVDAVRPDQAAE